MPDDWYYKSGETEHGPFTFVALQQLASQETLQPSDKVRLGIKGPWRFADSVPQLFGPSLARLGAQPPSSSLPVSEDIPEDAPESQGWYCRTLGIDLGPLSFTQLQQMVARAELSNDDLVRNSIDEEWRRLGSILSASRACGDQSSQPIEAGDVDSTAVQDEWYYRVGDREHGPTSLVELKSLASVSGETASEIVMRHSSEEHWQPLLSLGEFADQGLVKQMAAVPRVGGHSPQAGHGAPANLPRRISASRFVQKRSADQQWDRFGIRNFVELLKTNADIVGAATLLLTINAVLLAMSYNSYATERKYFETFREISTEMSELQCRNASSEDWSEFTSRANQKIEPILKDLDHTASVANPVRQHLRWAGRDYLSEMLSRAPQKSGKNSAPTEAEQFFEKHMSLVQQALGQQ